MVIVKNDHGRETPAVVSSPECFQDKFFARHSWISIHKMGFEVLKQNLESHFESEPINVSRFTVKEYEEKREKANL